MPSEGVPAARPTRTFFNIVWERGDRWVIRPATRYIWAVYLGVVMIFPAAYLCWRWPDAPTWVAFAIPAALLAGRTLGGRSCIVDWRAKAIIQANVGYAFTEVRGLALKSALFTMSSVSGSTSWQIWSLGILRSDDAGEMQLCWSTDNLRLLRAARRLARALDVPLYDQSGPNGLVCAWHPELGAVPLTNSIAISADAGAEIPEPRAPANAGERPTTDGVEIFWNPPRRRSPWGFLLVSVGLNVLAIWLAVRSNPGWLILIAYLAGPMLVITLVLSRDYGLNFVRVTSRHVTLGRPFPFRHTYRVRRAAIAEVRILERVSSPTARPVPTPHREIVQLLDERAALLCGISVPSGMGIWLALGIQRALGAHRARADG